MTINTAATKTITAITKASPAVVSSTAHGYVNGDYVLIAAQGMFQVDSRVFRVSATAANTFGLEGEDSTLFDTFTSGTAQLVTFGTTMTTATGLTALENLWRDPADPALPALKLASDNQAQRVIRFTFSGGQKFMFNGYIEALPAGGFRVSAFPVGDLNLTRKR